MRAVEILELLGDLEGAVGRSVVHDHELPLELAGRVRCECGRGTYCSAKAVARRYTITGRFFRSLYVGRITEYLTPAISSTTAISKRRFHLSLRRRLAMGKVKRAAPVRHDPLATQMESTALSTSGPLSAPGKRQKLGRKIAKPLEVRPQSSHEL